MLSLPPSLPPSLSLSLSHTHTHTHTHATPQGSKVMRAVHYLYTSYPVSPRPWRKSSVAECLVAAFTTTALRSNSAAPLLKFTVAAMSRFSQLLRLRMRTRCTAGAYKSSTAHYWSRLASVSLSAVCSRATRSKCSERAKTRRSASVQDVHHAR